MAQHTAAPMPVLEMFYAVNQAVKDGKLSVDEAMEIVEVYMNKSIHNSNNQSQQPSNETIQQQIFE